MTKKIVLLSLALDLKRISGAIQRDSSAVLKFNSEAIKFLKMAKNTNDKNMQKLLNKIEISLKSKNDAIKAEDCLMYSFLIQNRALALDY